MGKIYDRVGCKYNRLVVTSYAHRKNGKAYWNCLCDCKNTTVASGSNLVTGAVKSCGCAKKGCNIIHGKTGTVEYSTWARMRQRCYNELNLDYESYGGRGIIVCERWHDFENFLEDMGKRPNNKSSIDRIDNDGNYELSNCKWSSDSEQAINKRNTLFVVYRGERIRLKDLCRKLNKNYISIYKKTQYRDLNIEDAINTTLLPYK